MNGQKFSGVYPDADQPRRLNNVQWTNKIRQRILHMKSAEDFLKFHILTNLPKGAVSFKSDTEKGSR